jgi:hypothetical protein
MISDAGALTRLGVLPQVARVCAGRFLTDLWAERYGKGACWSLLPLMYLPGDYGRALSHAEKTMKTLDTVRAEFEALLARLKPQLGEKAAETAVYATTITEQLALAAGKPGFDQAAAAARDSIITHAAIAAVDVADLSDTAVKEVVLTAVRFGAGMLAAVAA